MKIQNKQVIGATLIVLALIATALLPTLAGAVILDRIVAVVGNEAITWIDLRRTMEEESLDEAEADFLQTLVVRRLQVQAARKYRVNASDTDIDMAINDIRQKYGLEPEPFKKVIEKEGLIWSRYRNMVGDQISMQRVVDVQVRRKIPTPEAMPEASALYSVRLALFDLSVGEALARAKSEEFMSELKLGKNFRDLLARYSDGPMGELSIEESQLASEMKTALAGLNPGQVSEPFMTDRGIMVVQLLKRETPEQVELERLFQSSYRKWIKELVENAYIDIRL
jgi:peptidyl-prolyl cis-trans isomerase SurA